MIDFFARRANLLRAEAAAAHEQARLLAVDLELCRRDLAESRENARQAWAIVETLGNALPRTVAQAALTVCGFSATPKG